MFLAQDLDDFDHHIPPASAIKIHTPELCALSWIKCIGAASYPIACNAECLI